MAFIPIFHLLDVTQCVNKSCGRNSLFRFMHSERSQHLDEKWFLRPHGDISPCVKDLPMVIQSDFQKLDSPWAKDAAGSHSLVTSPDAVGIRLLHPPASDSLPPISISLWNVTNGTKEDFGVEVLVTASFLCLHGIQRYLNLSYNKHKQRLESGKPGHCRGNGGIWVFYLVVFSWALIRPQYPAGIFCFCFSQDLWSQRLVQ